MIYYLTQIPLFRVILATVRNNGTCPCPRCLIQKKNISKVGQTRDSQTRLSQARSYVGGLVNQARDFIFKLGYNVASAAVERLLFAASWVPTLVCFFLFFEIVVDITKIYPRTLLLKRLGHSASTPLRCW